MISRKNPRLVWCSLGALALALLGGLSPLSAQTGESPATPPPPTFIESDTLEMESTDTHNLFVFTDNVRALGNNLSLRCQRLEVMALRSAEGTAGTMQLGQIGAIERIVATGDVVIEQSGRRAQAGRAEVLPREEKVVLTENPVVVDAQFEVRGWRITLKQGERRAFVESAPPGTTAGAGQRPTITLDSLPDLGFDPSREPAPVDSAPAPAPATTTPAPTTTAPAATSTPATRPRP